jgi:hypothetical protein
LGAGIIAYYINPAGTFYIVLGMSIVTVLCVWSIPSSAIDDDAARGLEGDKLPGKHEQDGVSS